MPTKLQLTIKDNQNFGVDIDIAIDKDYRITPFDNYKTTTTELAFLYKIEKAIQDCFKQFHKEIDSQAIEVNKPLPKLKPITTQLLPPPK